jgi:hypothetical protein|tara:strand:- start:1698 stop:2261 length:564 start_codon:yes stop_codon:yes gene_type:complete
MDTMTEFIEILAFLDPFSLALIAGTTTKLFSATQGQTESDTNEGIKAAKDVSNAQRDSLGKDLALASKKNNSEYDKLLEQVTGSGRKSLTEILSNNNKTGNASGFQNNEAGTAVVDNTRASVYQSASESVDSILEENEMNRQSVDLNTQKAVEAISKDLDSTMTNILSTPDTFLEKLTGTSNYKAGR